MTVRAFIGSVNVSESEGLYQTTDLKVIFGNKELGDYYPTQADRIQYTQGSETAKPRSLTSKPSVETTLSCTASSRGHSNGKKRLYQMLNDIRKAAFMLLQTVLNINELLAAARRPSWTGRYLKCLVCLAFQ